MIVVFKYSLELCQYGLTHCVAADEQQTFFNEKCQSHKETWKCQVDEKLRLAEKMLLRDLKKCILKKML